jgi:hypothetical protein
VVVLARDGVALHPHPVPPLALTAASSAQHALTPAGAGPPQQPVVAVFRGSFVLFVCFVFMIISNRELAARHLHRRRPPAMDAWGSSSGRASFRAMARPYR